MRKPSITDLIYQKTFPKPKSTDPSSFYIHVHRNIVGEIRAEVQTYYGTIDTLEAQYPGLDYTYSPHRRRLSRYAWHRRLFRVFDELRLTPDEILNLCKWEGTRAAKERYEEEAQTKIKTTTGNDVVAAPIGSGPRAVFEDLPGQLCDHQPEDVAGVTKVGTTAVKRGGGVEDNPSSRSPNDVFEALQDIVLSHLRGQSPSTNQALEQWLREALERNETDLESAIQLIETLEAGFRRTNTSTEENTNEPEQSDREQTHTTRTGSDQGPTLAQSHIYLASPVQTSGAYDDHSVSANSTRQRGTGQRPVALFLVRESAL